MASLVLVETNGTLKTLKTKEVSLETLYKKCGFRVNDDFLLRHTWKVKLSGEEFIVSVWAKKTGKANFENKYDFPPPVDNDLFFGTCAVVCTGTDGGFLDLTKETWLKIYEKLFGGFEDIGSQDEYSEDELANVDPALLTKNGYLKDGFVVSDKEAITSGETTSVDISEEEIVEKKPLKKKAMVKKDKAPANKDKVAKVKETEPATDNTKTKAKPKAKAKAKVVKEKEPVITEGSEGTTSELEEEVYTFSDDE